MSDEHHIDRETDEADEDLDRQDRDLKDDAQQGTAGHDDPGEEFHTDDGGEEPPPGSPPPDDEQAPETNPDDAF